MKSVLILAAVASLSAPAFAQSIAQPAPLTAATAKLLNDQDADTAAASDIARVQPLPEPVGRVELPASQIDIPQPESMSAGVSVQPTS